VKKQALALVLACAALGAAAQTPPTFETTKMAENVYQFRYAFHQAMFVVTPDGVIATDPIGYLRPQAVRAYLEEIRKVTSAPIRYLVYSHHHYDHIAGGRPFKEAGATIVAHRNARQRLIDLANPDVPVPDVAIDDFHAIELGGVRLELHYVGRNHSDNSLVMLLPKEKLAFTVDFVSFGSVLFRNLPDGYIPEWFDSLERLLRLDWERMIAGHPIPGGRFGTKDDVRAQLAYMRDLSNAVREAASQGKCWDAAMKEVRLPKYEHLANYASFLPMNVERFCNYWGRGY
jgi:glyoxylase-like metal-dependent hydrolase (beta-lactamase superfamily II)